MTKRKLPPRLAQPLALRADDDRHPNRTVLTGRSDYLDVPRVRQEMLERLSLLFEYYEIDADDADAWRTLAVALAFDHVSGFRVSKPGRKRSGEDLVHRFDTERSEWGRGKPSNMQIANKIGRELNMNGSTVLRRYQEQVASRARRLSRQDEVRLIQAMMPAPKTILGG